VKKGVSETCRVREGYGQPREHKKKSAKQARFKEGGEILEEWQYREEKRAITTA